VFVVGGLVDNKKMNTLHQCTLNKAQAIGARTGKLPIHLLGRSIFPVLNINTVVEILAHYSESILQAGGAVASNEEGQGMQEVGRKCQEQRWVDALRIAVPLRRQQQADKCERDYTAYQQQRQQQSSQAELLNQIAQLEKGGPCLGKYLGAGRPVAKRRKNGRRRINLKKYLFRSKALRSH
jgi:hypothetical protein